MPISVKMARRCYAEELRFSANVTSRAVIDACRPFEWMKDFPPVAESSPELKEKIYKKWKKVIEG